jgi:hypothetical protein
MVFELQLLPGQATRVATSRKKKMSMKRVRYAIQAGSGKRGFKTFEDSLWHGKGCEITMGQYIISIQILGVPSMGVPQNGWLIMGNPINMDDLCVPL